jgi:hypothetical protein
MRLFKRTALALLLASPLAMAQTAAPASSTPASPAAMQLALKLYDDIHTEAVFDALGQNIIENEMNGAARVAGDKGSCPALQTPAKAFVTRLRPILSTLADSQFRQTAAKIYADALSETELREITNFTESATGKKWSMVQSDVSQRVAQLASEKMKIREPQIRSAIGDFETSFKSALATCPAAPPQQGQRSTPAPAPVKRKK